MAAGAEFNGAPIVPLQGALEFFAVFEHDGHVGALLDLLLEIEGFGVGAGGDAVGIGEQGVGEGVGGLGGIAAAAADGGEERANEFACAAEGFLIVATLIVVRQGDSKTVVPGVRRCRRRRRDPGSVWDSDDVMQRRCWRQLLPSGEVHCKGIEAEGAEQVATHAGVNFIQAAEGAFDACEGEGVGQALKIGTAIDVAEAVRCVVLQHEDVLQEAGGGTEEGE